MSGLNKTDRELLQQSLNELEPYETIFEERNINRIIIAIKTRLAQPEKEWVGLTDEERYLNCGRTEEEIEYAKAIEAKLKDKNAA